MERRQFLQTTVASAIVAAAGPFRTGDANAAWQEDAFDARSVADALKGAFGTDKHVPSDAITIKAPNLAENGAMVPIEVVTTLAGLESISLLVEGNQNPLTATFRLSSDANRVLATRVKLGRSSAVLVIARAGGTLYSARKEIKVTIGGCGG
ncbi:MAG: thiosulfate oxidation carrier protein SoxY [Rhizobium sp.]|jgi:sulfur-oxidizing protein SoxY|nr:thiosulfate oxidation carrier protein SoxY [Rhizobium sp.]